MWQRISMDGCEWEVCAIPRPDGQTDAEAARREVLEFRPLDGLRRPRQLAVPEGSFAQMDERMLQSAYLKSRPVGGDHYGRPGKRMTDGKE